ncbi:MAG: hypothetical protein GXN93_05290 [Candidatus Diapherotrites archaeon]|nr:hypothetical protein [Candidatus Diapherotrites archaeon]
MFAVVGTSLMFLAFAAMAVAVASQPDLEDVFYNQYLLLPSSLQAASDAVSACTGYAIVQALDHSSNTHHPISSVTQSSVQNYFSTCTSTALGRIDSQVGAIGLTLSLTPSLTVQCGAGGTDCSSVTVTGSITYSFNLDSSAAGVRVTKSFTGTLPIDKNASVVPTGKIWVGNPSTPSDDRNVYRILVYDRLLKRIEVNGVWPR